MFVDSDSSTLKAPARENEILVNNFKTEIRVGESVKAGYRKEQKMKREMRRAQTEMR